MNARQSENLIKIFTFFLSVDESKKMRLNCDSTANFSTKNEDELVESVHQEVLCVHICERAICTKEVM